ncbi:MAG: YHYH protein [Bryobacteraceae bacterium]
MKSAILGILAIAPLCFSQDVPCPKDVFLDVSKYPGAGPQYPKPRLDAGCEGETLVVRSNGIPHYEFVQVTPNPLKEQDYEFRLPLAPKLASQPTPIPLLGSAGLTINGLVFYGPNEGPVPESEQFGDPIFNSIMDACMGHTALEYHYHAMVQSCLSAVKEGRPSPILGFAYDGFPIRGPWGCLDKDCAKVVKFKSSWEKVRKPHTDSWDAYDYVRKDGPEYLDQCNGRTGPDGAYSYHVTETWPYIIGCYAGEPVRQRRPGVSRGPGGPPPGGPPRPTAQQVAAAAAKLKIDPAVLAKALRVTPGSVKPINLAASARALQVTESDLAEALGLRRPPARQRPNQAPPGQAPCFFRCGQSDAKATGCTLTPDHKVVCGRPCENNRCG